MATRFCERHVTARTCSGRKEKDAKPSDSGRAVADDGQTNHSRKHTQAHTHTHSSNKSLVCMRKGCTGSACFSPLSKKHVQRLSPYRSLCRPLCPPKLVPPLTSSSLASASLSTPPATVLNRPRRWSSATPSSPHTPWAIGTYVRGAGQQAAHNWRSSIYVDVSQEPTPKWGGHFGCYLARVRFLALRRHATAPRTCNVPTNHNECKPEQAISAAAAATAAPSEPTSRAATVSRRLSASKPSAPRSAARRRACTRCRSARSRCRSWLSARFLSTTW